MVREKIVQFQGWFWGLVLLGVVLIPWRAWAHPVDQKSFRLGAGASLAYSHTSIGGVGADGFNVGVSGDYFVMNYVSVGQEFSVEYTSDPLFDQTLLQYGFSFGIFGYFLDRVVPYAKIAPGVGYVNIAPGDSETSFALSAEGGIDIMITKRIAAGIAFRYARMFNALAIEVFSLPVRLGLYF